MCLTALITCQVHGYSLVFDLMKKELTSSQTTRGIIIFPPQGSTITYHVTLQLLVDPR